ncbi:IS3 family transposase [Nonomuraea sp. M3C6]|uniref:IS3 family transposase n=1 Tax=Nonomuraea marmarensis TaxID=3351344 RepID=A0ABW7AQV0_9ACTN
MIKARFIAAQRTEYGIPHVTSCRALGVSPAWFYKWSRRDGPSERERRRLRLVEAVISVFHAREGRDGSPRVAERLRARGWRVSTNTVAQIMREHGLVARPGRKRKSTTRPGKGRWRAQDQVRRDFTAPAPNVRWVGDGTEIPTGEGKLYMAAVSDLFSRRILGYAMSEHHDAAVALASLQMAVAVRGGMVAGVVMHTDQGSEYTARLFRMACERLEISQSMGRTGSALDNAAAESLFSSMEFELLRAQGPFATRAQARPAIAAWVDDFNTERLHSAAGLLPPVEFERLDPVLQAEIQQAIAERKEQRRNRRAAARHKSKDQTKNNTKDEKEAA